MRRIAAALGSGAFLMLAPGTMGGLVPFLLTGWVSHDPPAVVFALGALLLVGGAACAPRRSLRNETTEKERFRAPLSPAGSG
jgi:hypothetical protein